MPYHWIWQLLLICPYLINTSLEIIYINLNVDITSTKFPETELFCHGPCSPQRHVINCQNVLQRV